MNKLLTLLAVFPLIIPTPVLACLWDRDTLSMESAPFPVKEELIAGNFARHSDAYYEWRIEDRSAKQKKDRTPEDYDDIAVAYDKLGQQDKAIETILEKMDRWPETGRYESEANLGTFLIHSQKLEEGLVHINKAIEINPEAHFGREVYQKLLVEYVLKARTEDTTLPLNKAEVAENAGFAAYVLSARNTRPEGIKEEIEKAAKGVMGMMRFGHHDSPILLEALADLMMYEGYDGDLTLSRHEPFYSYHAYLKASQEVEDEKAKEAYRQKAEQALVLRSDKNMETIETELSISLRKAKNFVRVIAIDEQNWIAAGKDVDAEFHKKYYEIDKSEHEPTFWRTLSVTQQASYIVFGFSSLFLFAVLLFVLWSRKRNTQLLTDPTE